MSVNQNKFRNASNSRLLEGLFIERPRGRESALYTLRREDHPDGFPSLYRLYMESTLLDPSEYLFATTYLDGWDHWEMLLKCSWFKEYASTWRRELEVRTRSLALRKVLEVAAGGTRDAFQANKFLLDGKWVDTPEARRGRKTNEAVKAEIKAQAAEERIYEEDYNRVFN